ncbi:uncharacterized protein V1516DRAFT_671243 [Lipomyces oligophaga]|uniref:uncharacterized protein n=1 Tax=Lipomyces oligophaga TaxID=45792 RepID=UPI0034CDAFBC
MSAMSSLFQAIIRPADDFTSILNASGSKGARKRRSHHRIQLIDRSGYDQDDEEGYRPLISDQPRSVESPVYPANRSRTPSESRAQIAAPPNLSTGAGEDDNSSNCDNNEVGTETETETENADENVDESAPLLSNETPHKLRAYRRRCGAGLERAVLRFFSCICICCPTSFDNLGDESEYLINDDGAMIPVIPSKYRKKGYKQLQEQIDMQDRRRQHLAKFISDTDSSSDYDILYENQRGFFFFGEPLFSSQSLVQIDPPSWQDLENQYSPVDILTAAVPDPSWEWAWHTWYIDMAYDVDSQGWSYAFYFRSRNWHGSHNWFTSFVRRRRWIRKRQRVKHLDSSDNLDLDVLGPILDRDRKRKPSSVVEGFAPEYFTVESYWFKARARKNMIKNIKQRNAVDSFATSRPLLAIQEHNEADSSALHPEIRRIVKQELDSKPDEEEQEFDYDFSFLDDDGDEDEDEDEQLPGSARMFSIGHLLRKLRRQRLDRQKIDSIERFVCEGGEDIVLLGSLMEEIVSYLVFQQSRRELLRSLLYYYRQIRSYTRKSKGLSGIEGEGEEFKAAAVAHSKIHEEHIDLDFVNMTPRDLSIRRKALHQAILVARREVLKLDFYSDRKLSNKEYAKADLLSDSYTKNDPMMGRLAPDDDERTFDEALNVEDVEEDSDGDDGPGVDENIGESSNTFVDDDDTSTITGQSIGKQSPLANSAGRSLQDQTLQLGVGQKVLNFVTRQT